MDHEPPNQFGFIAWLSDRHRAAARLPRPTRQASHAPDPARAHGPASGKQGGATTSPRPRIRELAERASSGTRVRLLWRQGTTQLWVEVREPNADRTLAIRVEAERALDAFHHPYAYAGLRSLTLPAEPLARL